MSDSFAPILPGDPLPTSAATWNAILESADAHRRGQAPSRSAGPSATDFYPGLTILVHNTTQSTLYRGDLRKVLPPYGDFSSTAELHNREIVYPLVFADSWSTSMVRLLDQIAPGRIGRATIVSPHVNQSHLPPGIGHPIGTSAPGSQVFRHFAGEAMANSIYYDSGFGSYGSLPNYPLVISLANNWSINGWPAGIQTNAWSTPVIRVDNTAVANGFGKGFWTHHPARFHATFILYCTITRPRYTVGTGYAFDGARVAFGFGGFGAEPTWSVDPVYVNASATPPSELVSQFVLRVETHQEMNPFIFPTDRLAPYLSVTRVSAFASGGPTPPSITLRVTDDRVRFEVLDVDDSITASGTINPPPPGGVNPGTFGFTGGSAQLQVPNRMGVSGVLSATSPDLESIVYARSMAAGQLDLTASFPSANLNHEASPE